MKQRLFILGASGSVGREFVRQVQLYDSPQSGNHRNPTEIVGIANSRSFVFDPAGIDAELLDQVAGGRDTAGSVFADHGVGYEALPEIIEAIENAGLNGEIYFIDLTCGKDDLLAFHKQIIEQTNNYIVTANKNPAALGNMTDFHALTHYHRRYNANVAVMAGGGPVDFVINRKEICDGLVHIQGCFSGTLTYIMSELDKGEKPFSQIVREAKENGYTEPNPWDDLNGVDVARKVLILARYGGYEAEFEDIDLRPLIAEKYGDLEGGEFLSALKELDEEFEQKRVTALAQGNVLRYVGEVVVQGGEPSLKVGVQEVPADSAIGSLSGTENIMVAETEVLAAPVPHVIKSRGAGLEVTASAMRVGVARMLPAGIPRE